MDLLVKKIAKFLIAGVIFLGIASADTDKFGFVDIKEVYYKYNKAIKLEEVFNKEVIKVSELEKSIKKIQTDYEQKRDLMKPEERIKKEAELKLKMQEYSFALSEFKTKMDEKQQETEKVVEEIKKEVWAYGEKNKYTMIFPSTALLYVGENVTNTTNEIIKIMNSKKTGDNK
ncbi:MAG: OmpH family outer membrane protein [Candidatus Ratteibacteria bacterium]